MITAMSVALLALVATPAMAGNGKPVERIKFTETFSGVADDIAADCGVDTVEFNGTEKLEINLFADGSARVHVNVKVAHTNPATGDQTFYKENRSIRESAPVVVSIDGDLVTSVREFTDLGVPGQYRVPGMGVIVKDAGPITVRGTFVADTSLPYPDSVVSESFEILSQHGQHSLAEQGLTYEHIAMLCEGLGGSIQF